MQIAVDAADVLRLSRRAARDDSEVTSAPKRDQ
jgi:hypothetical protein